MLATSPAAARPHSAVDLCRAVLAAGGCRESFARGLDRTLRHDAERGLLEVQAGVSWHSLVPYIGASFLPGRVGESVAANCAGPDGEPVVKHLRSLTVATPGGELHQASRERAADLFRLAVGGFGAFGPFYSLTLDLASLARSAARAAAPARFEPPVEGPEGQAWVLELLVPPQRSDAAIDRIRAALAERRCRLRLLEARRTLAEAESFLRWARDEYVALRIEYLSRATLGACVSAAQLRQRLIDIALEAGGGFLPTMLPVATRAQAEAGYPMLGSFLAEKRRLDPGERVLSPWYRSVRRAWRGETCKVRWAKD